MPAKGVEKFTTGHLTGIAKLLARYSASLESVVDDMKSAGIEKVTIEGVGELVRSDTGFFKFCIAAKTAIDMATLPALFEGHERKIETNAPDFNEARLGMTVRRGRPPKGQKKEPKKK